MRKYKMKHITQISTLSLIILMMVGCKFKSDKKTEPTVEPTDTVVAPQIQDTAVMATYVNSIYRYHINYPKDILIPQGESDSGDGQVFSATNSQNELRVYRDTRDMIETGSALDKAYAEDVKPSGGTTITDKLLAEKYYTIEGQIGRDRFYQKTILRKDKTLVTAILTYQESDREIYEKLIVPIFSSMK